MARQSTLHFYPKRVVWIGLAALASCFVVGLTLLSLFHPLDTYSSSSREKRGVAETLAAVAFSLGLSDKAPVVPMPDLREEMTFSFDPPRSDGKAVGEQLLVRMKRSGESKRVLLPCRLDLEFQKDQLVFAKTRSAFGLELSLTPDGQILGKGEGGTFIVSVQEPPIQGAAEFPEGSPFRVLAEARWWGPDPFHEHAAGERLEMGADLLQLQRGDWLAWPDQKGKKWEKGNGSEAGAVARIQSHEGKSLILEGWDAEGYVRISLNGAAATPFKVKGEELLSGIRVRSEKLISCMLEKQCLVLKTGDWVVKTGGRWKVLRKKEERTSVLNGKIAGELFVFEQIAQKQGQKMVQGRLFNVGRTQVVPIEVAAQTTRKSRKGKTA